MLVRLPIGVFVALVLLTIMGGSVSGSHPAQLQLPWPTGQAHQITEYNLSYDCETHGPPDYPTNAKAIDFNLNAITGDEVAAVADGTVVNGADIPSDARGNFLEIDHGGNHRSRYLHLRTYSEGGPWAPGISIGSQVTQGQLIGYSGNTGGSTGPHLHFDLKEYDAFGQPLARITPEPMSGQTGFGQYGVCTGVDSPL